MRSRFIRSLPAMALAIVCTVAIAGCSDSGGKKVTNDGGSGGSTGGTGGGGGGTGGTGGTGGSGGTEVTHCTQDTECSDGKVCDLIQASSTYNTCIEPCTVDTQCGFNTGTRCDDNVSSATKGHCIPAEPCQGVETCGSQSGYGDYCDEWGTCVCVADTTISDPYTGICRRRTNACQPCQSDDECGASSLFDNPRECKVFNYGGQDVGVCLPKKGTGTCPAGMLPANVTEHPELAGYCTPQGGDCAAMNPCRSDDECLDPANPVCDRIRQVCIPGCKFDFISRQSVGCAPGNVCHALPSNLNPDLLEDCSTTGNFGVGKCDVPCASNDDCAGYGAGFVCKQDGSEKRCRPAGCLDDMECPETPGATYLGFCDIKADYTQNSCVTDTCRTGTDPRAGCGATTTYSDCNDDYKCVSRQGQANTCVEKNCIDRGGAGNGCPMGYFCAGEPMKDPLTGQDTAAPLSPPSGTATGACYALDTSVWCSQDCATEGATCNGPYSHPDSPSLCLTHPDRSLKCTMGCEYSAECPGRWTCSSQGLEATCGDDGLKRCESNADCGGGTCVDPLVRGGAPNWTGAARFKVCTCDDSTACGTGYSCNAGLATAVQDPASPNFMQRQARYCAKNSACGPNGSCEWFGQLQATPDGSPFPPIFMCGTTPAGSPFPGAGTAVQVSCPDTFNGMDVRPGHFKNDQYYCVASSVCRPRYGTDDAGNMMCLPPPPPPR